MDTAASTPAPPPASDPAPFVIHHKRASLPLHARRIPTSAGETSLAAYLAKGMHEGAAPSRQKENPGEVAIPFDWAAAKAFKNDDPHHSACIEAKVGSAVGLGFKSDKVAKVLDPLCARTFLETTTANNEDYWLVGNAYLEVVRERSSRRVLGIHELMAEKSRIVVEDKDDEFHFVVRSGSGDEQHVPRFGDEKFWDRPIGKQMDTRRRESENYSEIIHLKRPTSLHRWYGMPDWLSAVAQIELAHAITQFNFDFFLNSGVPEFVLALIGAGLTKEDKEKVEGAIQSGTGMGNHHKTLYLQIPKSKQECELVLHKFGDEMAEGWFESMLETVAARIVTAHRVPPLLAGIQTPGKLGANNEFINAMWMFQMLVVKPGQNVVKSCLGNTLGGDDAGLGLKPEDFELKTIVEEVPVAQMEAPGAPGEPAKTLGTRKDIPGTRLTDRIQKALEALPAEERERMQADFFTGVINGLLKRRAA